MNQIIFRPYQIETLKAIKKNFLEGITRQLIVHPTGCGKRILACTLAGKPEFRNALFIAHREELIDQAYNEFHAMYPDIGIGIIKRDREEFDYRIVIGSIQTLFRKYDHVGSKHFDLILVDELHHYAANSYRKPLDYYEPKLLTGWTATPTRMDNLSLSDICDKIVYSYSLSQAIQDGYLCELEAIRIKTRTDISNVKKVAGDFNKKELSDIVDETARNELIVESHLKYCGSRQAIVSCVDMRHAARVNTAFRMKGISSEVIVSDEEITPNRKSVINDFKKGNIEVLTHVDILGEGFDYSDIGCWHAARPTQSTALYMQHLGRTTRLKSEKYIQKYGQKALILDYVDNCGKHKLVNSWSLDKDRKGNNKYFISKEKREEEVKVERDLFIKDEHIARIKSKYVNDKKVDLFAIPRPHISFSYKMKEPATDKQIKWLKEEGVYVEGNSYTKRQASEYINSFPATEKQIYKLAYLGYDVHANLTRGEAQAAFEEIAKKEGYKEEKEKEKEKENKPFNF